MRITVRHESGIRSILKKWGAAKLCGEKCFSLGTYNSAPLHYFPQRFCQIRLNLPGEELLDQPFWCKHQNSPCQSSPSVRWPSLHQCLRTSILLYRTSELIRTTFKFCFPLLCPIFFQIYFVYSLKNCISHGFASSKSF